MSMPIDAQKLQVLMTGAPVLFPGGELRRQGNVFFVGKELSLEMLEAIFADDGVAPVELFLFRFADLSSFLRMEETVKAVRKNFRSYLLGAFPLSPIASIVDRAYAAGLDLLDMPQPQGSDVAAEEAWLAALDYARTVFPRWSVLATLPIGAAPLPEQRSAVDLLLARGVLPLLSLPPAAAGQDASEIIPLFDYLQQQWQRAGAAIKPLLPLLPLIAPFSCAPPRRGLAGVLDKIQDAQLRTAADLRRLLRVREVEQSFESAGL